MSIQIAIDGPASSGKGTVARSVACELDFSYIDTGAMYRVVALLAEERGISWGDAEGLGKLAEELDFGFQWSGEQLVVLVGERDVSTQIRLEEIGQGASRVSEHPTVRTALLSQQKRLGEDGRVVMEGRDIGTVILPNADLKYYLDASLDERARRRTQELRRRGVDASLEKIRTELAQRDLRDKNRVVAPLRQAPDAIYLDTTSLSVSEIVNLIIEKAKTLDVTGITE